MFLLLLRHLRFNEYFSTSVLMGINAVNVFYASFKDANCKNCSILQVLHAFTVMLQLVVLDIH